jgi:hypothetical protein
MRTGATTRAGRLMDQIRKMDSDRNGTVDLAELRNLISSLNLGISDDDVRQRRRRSSVRLLAAPARGAPNAEHHRRRRRRCSRCAHERVTRCRASVRPHPRSACESTRSRSPRAALSRPVPRVRAATQMEFLVSALDVDGSGEMTFDQLLSRFQVAARALRHRDAPGGGKVRVVAASRPVIAYPICPFHTSLARRDARVSALIL